MTSLSKGSNMSNSTRRSLLLSVPVAALAKSQKKVKALIVDGFSNHDWRKTTAFINTTLIRTGLFEVAVSTSPGEPGDTAGWAAWRPDFASHDLIVLNMNNIQQPDLRWPKEVERNLEHYVARKGGGLLVYHSANNAFPHWAEYDRMIGLGWRNKDHGWALKLDGAGNIERIPPGTGEGTNHGPRQDTVVIRRNGHPINKGMPAKWLTPDIEVYRFARGPKDVTAGNALAILSYGRHIATDSYWPLEWVVKYGKGRVYSSSFGHIWKTDEGIPNRVRCIGFQTCLIRAAEWAATARVRYPIPPDFPTESSASLRRDT